LIADGGTFWSPTGNYQRFQSINGTAGLWTPGTQNIHVVLANGENTELRINGAADVTGDAGTGALKTTSHIFSQASGTIGTDRAFEMIIYGSDQSANYTGIENNINAYYDIY